mmetsp:Transcript_1877/g.5001  ORF Transcript_1877/g.5001 Transcript_1877/m.5001 type:complete len:203 (+) Transcript_1877:115-723(+)
MAVVAALRIMAVKGWCTGSSLRISVGDTGCSLEARTGGMRSKNSSCTADRPGDELAQVTCGSACCTVTSLADSELRSSTWIRSGRLGSNVAADCTASTRLGRCPIPFVVLSTEFEISLFLSCCLSTRSRCDKLNSCEREIRLISCSVFIEALRSGLVDAAAIIGLSTEWAGRLNSALGISERSGSKKSSSPHEARTTDGNFK